MQHKYFPTLCISWRHGSEIKDIWCLFSQYTPNELHVFKSEATRSKDWDSECSLYTEYAVFLSRTGVLKLRCWRTTNWVLKIWMYHQYCCIFKKSELVTLAASGNWLYKAASNAAYWQIHVVDVLVAFWNAYSLPYLDFFWGRIPGNSGWLTSCGTRATVR
jgi:hypothetical protein